MSKMYVAWNPPQNRLSIVLWPKEFPSLDAMAEKLAEYLNDIVFKEASVQLIAIPKELPREDVP